MNIAQIENITAAKQYPWNEEDLEEFREMVLKEEDLNSRTDDIFLLSFLRSRKYNKQRALELLRNYYSVRRNVAELKSHRPSAIEHVLQADVTSSVFIDNGRLLIFGRASHWDTTKISAIDLGKSVLLHLDYYLNDHRLQVNGLSYILDLKGLSWKHVICFTPRIVKLHITCFMKTLPVSYKSAHLINVNRYIFVILTLLWPFFPKKLRDRIHLHGSNLEALHKEIDPKYLPVEFGGTSESFDWSESNQLMKDNEEFFRENEKYWNNEKKN
ncbi:clavesin-1-like [Centruroides vittatus]|uniref:clavesin-1-like n=1 Tax=Centruroides vittatus TaxID=120091 RepID=UPI00350EB64E